ncbi:MAG TPA: hypothetical protein VII57_05990 [Dehalococcoidia bacterium]|nr:hypothetical protein [Dehalococcoidia bacterium]
MPRRKSTLRRMPPVTRDLARLQDELKSVTRRLDRIIQLVQLAELYASAFIRQNQEKPS